MKKMDMNELLEKIEDYYERNEKLFQDCCDDKEGEPSQTKEESERELDMSISSLGSQKTSRPVHMPGYPE